MSRDEVLALPPVISLSTLALVLQRSEPTIRAAVRNGELERMGITVNKLGAKYQIVTASVLAYLHLGADSGSSTETTPLDGPGKKRPASSALRSVR